MAVTARRRSIPQNFLANCQTGDSVGDLVYSSGGMVGGYYTVTKVDISDPSKMPAVGMIVAKVSPTICVVQVGGEIKDIYSGFVPGRHCFVGTDARLTQVVPTAPPTGVRYSQPAAYAIASNVLLFRAELPTVRTAN